MIYYFKHFNSKCIVLWLFLNVPFVLNAQFKSARISIHGLTCSACSYATEKSIYTLDFVDQVAMDLNENIAFVLFKKDKEIDPIKLIQRVKDAGFSVGFLELNYTFTDATIANKECLVEGEKQYFILHTSDTTLIGKTTFRFIHKSIMQKKEYKKYTNQVNPINFDTCKPDYILSLK